MTRYDSPRRYARQAQFAGIGEAGQQRIGAARVLICGCGALGSVLANTLARAGIGHLRIVDRDFVELNNLQRQVLFNEEDVAAHLPKAIAAAQQLEKINSSITIEPIVADVDFQNIARLVEGVDVIADGTDNFETRFLLNDAAHHFGIPWVYGGCIGAEGQSLTIVPGETPCLRCLVTEVPAPGTMPTCDTAGIIGPIVNVIASWQAAEVLKLVSGAGEHCSRTLNVFDLWTSRVRHVSLDRLRGDDSAGEGCVTCGDRNFEWLSGAKGSHAVVLCGRNAVQLALPDRQPVSLVELRAKLEKLGRVFTNDYLLRFDVDQYTLTIFPDGRAVIGGTSEPSEARTVYARYVGH